MKPYTIRRVFLFLISLYITYSYVIYLSELDLNLYNYAQIYLMACIEVIMASLGLHYSLLAILHKYWGKYEF
jgi:hypothetical protein